VWQTFSPEIDDAEIRSSPSSNQPTRSRAIFRKRQR
jgi:hypothetical protein